MSNGINPNDPNRINAANLNQNRKGQAQDNEQEEKEQVQGSPSSHKQLDSSKVFDFLSNQGLMNISTGNVENVAVAKSMQDFMTQITPERHQEMFGSVKQAINDEFGSMPNDSMVQEVLDDYLIGIPVIQTA